MAPPTRTHHLPSCPVPDLSRERRTYRSPRRPNLPSRQGPHPGAPTGQAQHCLQNHLELTRCQGRSARARRDLLRSKGHQPGVRRPTARSWSTWCGDCAAACGLHPAPPSETKYRDVGRKIEAASRRHAPEPRTAIFGPPLPATISVGRTEQTLDFATILVQDRGVNRSSRSRGNREQLFRTISAPLSRWARHRGSFQAAALVQRGALRLSGRRRWIGRRSRAHTTPA